MTSYPCFEVTEWIDASGGEDNHKCFQCGTCAGLCPWGPLTGYSNRNLLVMTQLGAEGIENHIWQCSTCGLCKERCPRGLQTTDVVLAIRRAFAEGGMLPGPLRTFSGSMQANGNPWSGEKDERVAWAEGMDLPVYEDQEYAWFPCCTLAYDPRNRTVAKAQLKLMLAAGLDFGAFGNEMVCCAESLGKIGNDELTETLRGQNKQLFADRGAGKLLVSSPHCLDTFKKDYDLPDIEAAHIVEVLAEQLSAGKLTPDTALEGMTITYHDPCYLGRHNEVYDAPRQVLEAVGAPFVEMPRNRELSFCCGGGGGKMWVEVESGQRPSESRVEEAIAAGANVLVTSCPYCISMFEDAIKTLDVDSKIRVMDISELVAQACGL